MKGTIKRGLLGVHALKQDLLLLRYILPFALDVRHDVVNQIVAELLGLDAGIDKQRGFEEEQACVKRVQRGFRAGWW